MNLIQWMIASFCTTGRIKYDKKPKEWASYEWITFKVNKSSSYLLHSDVYCQQMK